MNTVGTFNVLRLSAEKMAAAVPDASGERGCIINTARFAHRPLVCVGYLYVSAAGLGVCLCPTGLAVCVCCVCLPVCALLRLLACVCLAANAGVGRDRV